MRSRHFVAEKKRQKSKRANRLYMKLIAGLGNPGKKYQNNRHNIGFRVTDKLACKYNVKLKKKLLQNCRHANILSLGQDVVIVQPLTYMNRSGDCILYFYKKLSLNLQDILIICDDINLPLGKIRLRPGGSAGGHNGLSSVITSLASEEFLRLRIGIKTDEPISDLSEYVLLNFSKEEEEIIERATDDALCACENWLEYGTETAMNRYNKEVLN